MSQRVVRPRATQVVALLLALLALRASAEERIDLVPERPAAWRAERLIAPFRAATRGPRLLRIDTEPSGALLELAYVRDGAQQRHARGVAPLVLLLPSLAHTGAGDTLAVRAELLGFEPRELEFAASRTASELRVSLARLPNHLLAASLLELGDRARLTLISEEPLAARLAASERGWRLVLPRVALDERLTAALAGIHGETVRSATASSLAGDVKIELMRGAAGELREIRLATRAEPVRGLHHFSLDWVSADGGAATLAAAHRALAADAPRCGLEFDRALREALDSAELSRALAPSGAFTDALLTLAIEQLAASSASGEVLMRDGSRIALARPLERDRVLAQPADALGLLAALRSLADSLAPRGTAQSALHAWLAPELSAERFAAAFELALAAEARCASEQ